MSIESGSRIGPYQVTSPLGEGGMGVVYRAHDTKLQRDVALKLLPQHFAKDPDRLSRFQREAQLLASLNHPNIAQIYGLEEVDGAACIVMELVDGETLSERLKRGPFAIDEAIEVAKQVADALAAAHERGIVHRDLKPANIKLTSSGTVKVLDFGLAKALARTGTTSMSALPTSAGGSVAGMIVGTAAYMSPEQARGREVDARTDIWAFGCVLYEMLTARLAFEGETMTDIMARIVTGSPDLSLLPAETPASVRALLSACLNKNAQQRLQHIGDMRLFLDETLVGATGTPAAAAAQPAAKSSKLPVAVLGVLLLAALIPAALYFRGTTPNGPVMRLEMSMPGLVNNAVAPSPDGQRVAYLIQSPEGQRTLWVRPMGSDKGQQVSGTENTNGMIWSADSKYLLFVVAGKLKRIDPSGGPAQQIADVAGNRLGFASNRNGVVVFARSDGQLVRVSDSGGEVRPIMGLDAARKEVMQGFPSFLPDGNHFVYASVSTTENTGFWVASIDGKTPPTKLMTSSLMRTFGLAYAEPGFIVYAVEGKLTAQRFNPKSLKLEGDPLTLSDDIDGGFTVTDTGLLMFRKTAPEPNTQLQWYDRLGRQLGAVGSPANYGGIDLSPNEDRVAVDITSNNNRDVWVVDVARGIPSRITFDPASDWSPQWSPDGSRLAFASAGRSATNGATQIFEKSSSGVGTEELVQTDGGISIPSCWSLDNKYIVFSRTKQTYNDTWILPLFGERKPKPLLESPFDKIQARVSPDSRWIAYTTNETGAFQIVVQSFPDPNGGKWQISANGGVEPKWRHDGRELYYLAYDGKLMSVPIKADRTLEAGKPTVLFQTQLTVNRARPDRDRHYDVSHDGQKFLIVTPEARQNSTPLTALVNWPSLFNK